MFVGLIYMYVYVQYHIWFIIDILITLSGLIGLVILIALSVYIFKPLISAMYVFDL